ncbi:MAG: hypothetical protein ACW98Y_17885, partial [Candidatus Thorarchaeota archaeon]
MNKKEPRIAIRSKLDEIEFEIQIDNIKELEDAYLLMLDARQSLGEIKLKHQSLIIAKRCQEISSKYMKITEEEKKIINIDDRSMMIMLSLLDSFPESRKVVDIAEETNIPRPTVSKYLNGHAGDKAYCFSKSGDEWTLSSKGISETA